MVLASVAFRRFAKFEEDWMLIVVADASGVVGRAFIPALVGRGHDVAGVVRGAASHSVVIDLGAEPFIAAATSDPSFTMTSPARPSPPSRATWLARSTSSMMIRRRSRSGCPRWRRRWARNRPFAFRPFLGRLILPEHLFVMMTDVRGGSSEKFKRAFDWQPKFSSWRDGFRRGLR